MNFSGVVLAGGASTRMGRDKALIRFRGRTLLEHQVQSLRAAGVAEILISHRPDPAYAGFGLPLVSDVTEGAGPLAGITSALSMMQCPHLLVLAVDMPAIRVDYLRKLQLSCHPGTGAVPCQPSGYEPLAACYPREALLVANQQLADADRSMQTFVHACLRANLVISLPILADELALFVNWNRPEDQNAGTLS